MPAGTKDNVSEPPPVVMLPTPLVETEEAVKTKEAMKTIEAVKTGEAVKAEEAAALATPVWTQVHPSRPAVPVGLVPHSLGDELCCHHSHSHCSQRRVHLQAQKDQQSGDPTDSVPNAT